MNAGPEGFRAFAYGAEPAEQGDQYLPEVVRPAVVCRLHGGFRRMPYGRGRLAPHAADLARHRYAGWASQVQILSTQRAHTRNGPAAVPT
jgi:hypothetical protein